MIKKLRKKEIISVAGCNNSIYSAFSNKIRFIYDYACIIKSLNYYNHYITSVINKLFFIYLISIIN